MGERYGRSESEWEDLVREGHRFLVQAAELERTTDYTSLNGYLRERTGTAGFDFSAQSERTAIGDLLGDIVAVDLPDSGHMITAIVMYLDSNEPGEGFYRLAQSLGRLEESASAAAKERFWVSEMTGIYDHYARRQGRRRRQSSSS